MPKRHKGQTGDGYGLRRGSPQLRHLAPASIDPQHRHRRIVQPAIAEYRRDEAEREVLQRQSTHMQDKKGWKQVGKCPHQHDAADDAQAFGAVEAARESFLEDVIAIPGIKPEWE